LLYAQYIFKEEDTLNMITDVSELLEKHELCIPNEDLGRILQRR
jgi:hypothetical protein